MNWVTRVRNAIPFITKRETAEEAWPDTPTLAATYDIQMPNGDSGVFSIDVDGGLRL